LATTVVILSGAKNPRILHEAPKASREGCDLGKVTSAKGDDVKENVWEFLRRADGTYAVFHKGKLLSDGIPERYREKEFCVRFGFCGDEYREISRQLSQSDKCVLVL
jgi:hypothetical protein